MRRCLAIGLGLLLGLATALARGETTTGPATQPAPVCNPQVIAALIDRLGASDYKTRQAAQEALVQIGPEAVPALRAVADGTDPERAARAKDALASIVRRRDRITSILDVRPPFTFTVRTVTMQGKPQAGVKVRCVHPRPGRAKPLVDMVVPTDANGVATFTVNSADLLADRHFWISLNGGEFLGDGLSDLSPIDRQFDATWMVLPTRPGKLLVVNERDEPLAAATVVLELNLRAAVDGLRSITNTCTAHTDSKGQATIDFPDEEAALYAAAKGYASTTVTKARLSADRPLIIKLPKGASITGSVHSLEAAPISGVVLNARKMAPGHYTREFILKAVSDAAGKFSLDGASPGRWEVTAHVEDGRLWAFAPSYVDVPENQRTTDIMVHTRPGFRMKGKYVASRSETMSWQEELILASISGIKGRNGGYRLEFPVCPDGTFDLLFETSGPGNFLFMGQAGYYARVKIPDTLPFFTVPGEREDCLDFTGGVPSGTYEGVEVCLLRTSTLWGRLLDSRGQPLAQQEVLVYPGGTFSKTDKDGRFTTEVPPLKDVQLQFRRAGEIYVYLTADLKDVKEGQIVEKTFVSTIVTSDQPAPQPPAQPAPNRATTQPGVSSKT